MLADRLTALERRFRESGDARDEASLLRERFRAGLLDRDRLELAAHLGHAAAADALRVESAADGLERRTAAPAESDPHRAQRAEWQSARELVALCAGLARWGKAACVRAAVGLVTEPRVLAYYRLWPKPHAIDEQVMAAWAWLACPCAEHARAGARFASPSITRHPRLGVAAGSAEEAAGDLARTVQLAVVVDEMISTRNALERIREAVIPWALDPPQEPTP